MNFGRAGEPLCETPVRSGKFGVALNGSLNLAAAVVETEIDVENHAICGTIVFTNMNPSSILQT
ncbi:MAG: NrpR regulatory domain-containing protein [Dehalococcoidales bacterium]|nr:NrpR regulatory domain-containing protein [Dehalococcoidales bacterium]